MKTRNGKIILRTYILFLKLRKWRSLERNGTKRILILNLTSTMSHQLNKKRLNVSMACLNKRDLENNLKKITKKLTQLVFIQLNRLTYLTRSNVQHCTTYYAVPFCFLTQLDLVILISSLLLILLDL